MEGKVIIRLIFVFATTIGQAQNNNKYIPPDMTTKTRSFALSELQVDSIFVENLNIVLFNKNDRYMNSIMSNPHERSWRHFYIQFDKKDSLSYYVVVSLGEAPSENSIGFFKHNGFLYWFSGDVPPNIILKKKSKKRFSYTENLIMFIDPPFWFFIYNKETGNIEVKEKYYD